jgi:hypothetical protein
MDGQEDPFGFRVKREKNGELSASLPHQCDRWEITGDTNLYKRGEPHEKAVREFAAFLAEAREAFEALSRNEEYRP